MLQIITQTDSNLMWIVIGFLIILIIFAAYKLIAYNKRIAEKIIEENEHETEYDYYWNK